MNTQGSLKDFRVAVVVSDGFEEQELTDTVRRLKEVGARIDIISPHSGVIQAFKHQEPSIQVKVDRTLDQVNPGDYDGLLLPGGALNADELRANPKALAFVKQFDEAQKPIAAICHAPWILVSAGVVSGRMLTSYFTIKDDLRNGGAHWADQMVVVDRNFVTSRSPNDIPAFNREMVKLFTNSYASIIQISASA